MTNLFIAPLRACSSLLFVWVGPTTRRTLYFFCRVSGDYGAIEAGYAACVKAKQPFERLVVTKAEALALFAYNPFKTQLIAAKVTPSPLPPPFPPGSGRGALDNLSPYLRVGLFQYCTTHGLPSLRRCPRALAPPCTATAT
jgi:hypothetical protein